MGPSGRAALELEGANMHSAGLEAVFRWFHVFAGITWIGLLYFFNWINGPLMAKLDGATMQAHMKGMQAIGVPYMDGDIEAAAAEVEGKTEEDAMVAYLQVLGTMAKLDDSKVYRE